MGDRDAEAQTVGSRRERLGYWRDVALFTRDFLIAILIVACIVQPQLLRGWLTSLGVSKATILGLELTPGNEEKLAATISTLTQERDNAIAERNQFAKKAEDALKQLAESGARDPQVERSLEQVRTALKPANLAATSGVQANIIEGARQALGSDADWAVVFGGDPTLSDAADEIRWARQNGLQGAEIYHRQNSFRSVVRASSLEAAQQALNVVRRRQRDAYLVNLATWCPKTTSGQGFTECVGSP